MEIIKATLDRFEDNYAIIYSDQDNRRFELPKNMIQANAGSKILIYLEDGKIVRIEVDEEGTKKAKEDIIRKYKRLLERK